MERKPADQNPLNKKDYRRNLALGRNRGNASPEAQENRIVQNLSHSVIRWNEVMGTHKDYAQIIYDVPPFIYDFMSAKKDYSKLVERKRAASGNRHTDTLIHTKDGFMSRHHGVSLEDIDSMHTPLSSPDVKKISNLFVHRLPLVPAKTEQAHVAQSLIYLAAVPFAQRDRMSREPDSINNLKEVSQAYFDYYTKFIQGGFTSSSSEASFLLSLNIRKGMLLPGLAAYIPARLGISPSSTDKLWQKHEHFSEEYRASWKILGKFFKKDLRNAIHHTVPENLRHLLTYSPQDDTAAAADLQKYYDKSNSTAENNNERIRGVKVFNQEVRPRISKEISQNHGSYTYALNQDHPVESVIALDPYLNSTMFILNFKNGSHLVIEIGTDGAIYGIPNELYDKSPHIEDLLIPDLLRVKLPERQIKEQALRVLPNTTHDLPQVITPTAQQEENPQTIKLPKKRLLRRLTGVSTDNEPEELPIYQEGPKRYIHYSETLVREKLGGKKASQTDIDKAMNMLYRFEQGWKDGKPLVKDPKLFTIRGGNLRIIVAHKGENQYDVEVISDRGEAYEDYK